MSFTSDLYPADRSEAPPADSRIIPSLNYDVLLYLMSYLDSETLKSFECLNRTIYATTVTRLWRSISIHPRWSSHYPDPFIAATSFLTRPAIRLCLRDATIVAPYEPEEIIELMTALGSCPNLESLHLWGCEKGLDMPWCFDAALLPPTLQSFETNLTDGLRHASFGLSLEHLSLHDSVDVITAPLSHLTSIRVQSVSQCIHVRNRPVSHVEIGGDTVDWISGESIHAFLSCSSAPTTRLTIQPTLARTLDDAATLLDLYSDIGRLKDLRFLSIRHSSSVLDRLVNIRDALFETIASLASLEELEWTDEISIKTRDALLDFIIQRCPSVRYVKMLTDETDNGDNVLFRLYEVEVNSVDGDRVFVEITAREGPGQHSLLTSFEDDDVWDDW